MFRKGLVGGAHVTSARQRGRENMRIATTSRSHGCDRHGGVRRHGGAGLGGPARAQGGRPGVRAHRQGQGPDRRRGAAARVSGSGLSRDQPHQQRAVEPGAAAQAARRAAQGLRRAHRLLGQAEPQWGHAQPVAGRRSRPCHAVLGGHRAAIPAGPGQGGSRRGRRRLPGDERGLRGASRGHPQRGRRGQPLERGAGGGGRFQRAPDHDRSGRSGTGDPRHRGRLHLLHHALVRAPRRVHDRRDDEARRRRPCHRPFRRAPQGRDRRHGEGGRRVPQRGRGEATPRAGSGRGARAQRGVASPGRARRDHARARGGGRLDRRRARQAGSQGSDLSHDGRPARGLPQAAVGLQRGPGAARAGGTRRDGPACR